MKPYVVLSRLCKRLHRKAMSLIVAIDLPTEHSPRQQCRGECFYGGLGLCSQARHNEVNRFIHCRNYQSWRQHSSVMLCLLCFSMKHRQDHFKRRLLASPSNAKSCWNCLPTIAAVEASNGRHCHKNIYRAGAAILSGSAPRMVAVHAPGRIQCPRSHH